MRFSDQLAELAKRTRELEDAAGAAANETSAQVKARIDQAEGETRRALEAAQQRATAAGAQAEDLWSKLKADAASRHDDVKARIDKRGREMDAKVTDADARWAEDDAVAAIDYAGWAIGNAKYAVLNAIEARANADERAAAARA